VYVTVVLHAAADDAGRQMNVTRSRLVAVK
jgi:hypothetical protein